MAAKKKVAVLAKSGSVVRFLKSFFENRRNYLPSFFRDPDLLRSHIRGTPLSAIIAEASFLKSLTKVPSTIPTIAVITGDVKQGIEDALRHGASKYVYRPYLDVDLEYKINTAIADRDTVATMKTQVRDLEAIVSLTRLFSATRNPKELLFGIVTKIADLIPVTRCSIIKVDWAHRSALVIASFEDSSFTDIKLSLRKYPEIEKALKSKQPVFIRDVSLDPLMEKVRDIIAPLNIRSILVLPILLHTKIIGTLFLRTSRANHTFTESEISLLRSLANASASALYNALLFEQVETEKSKLQKLAVTDYLTGIYNIRHFSQRITEEFSRCQRYALPITCLMLDIDHFKKINDVYGHKTGDQVLKEFAQLLRKNSRKSDVLARYGGEEFILLLPQTGSQGGKAEAERINAYVKNHKFRSLKDHTMLTVSVGVATYPHKNIKTHDDLISLADNALFKAKNRGRDRVVVHGK